MSGLPDIEPRTTCRDCGEELWGAAESRGLCVDCWQEREDEILRDGEPEPDEDDEAESQPDEKP